MLRDPDLEVVENKIKSSNVSDHVQSLSVVLNPSDNGGEGVTLTVDVYDNGDKEDNTYTKIKFETMCYGVSSTSVTLYTVSLDDLERAIKMIKERMSK